jgi:hypothetical protein
LLVVSAVLALPGLAQAAEFIGIVHPQRDLRLSVHVAGVVEQVLVQVGQRVAAGQVILRQEARLQTGERERRRIVLADTSELRSVEQRGQMIAGLVRDAEALYARAGTVSRDEVVKLRLELEAASGRAEQLREAEKRERAELDLDEREVSLRVLRAPIAGEVIASGDPSLAVGDLQGFVHLIAREDGRPLGRLVTDGVWPEQQSLARLRGLFEAKEDALALAFPGRARAVIDMMRAMEKSLDARHQDWTSSITLFATTVTHIRQIIMLQRSVVRGSSGERERVDLRRVLEDALVVEARCTYDVEGHTSSVDYVFVDRRGYPDLIILNFDKQRDDELKGV